MVLRAGDEGGVFVSSYSPPKLTPRRTRFTGCAAMPEDRQFVAGAAALYLPNQPRRRHFRKVKGHEKLSLKWTENKHVETGSWCHLTCQGSRCAGAVTSCSTQFYSFKHSQIAFLTFHWVQRIACKRYHTTSLTVCIFYRKYVISC